MRCARVVTGMLGTAVVLGVLLGAAGWAAAQSTERRRGKAAAPAAEATQSRTGQKASSRRGKSKSRSSKRGVEEDVEEDEVRSVAAKKMPPTPLDGTRWLLESYRGGDGQGVTPLEGSQPTARFQAGRIISGSAGCNDFTAGFTWDAGDLTVSHAATTKKACPEPVMDQEEAYLAALHHVARFTLGEGTLVLRDVGGSPLLTYQREPPPVLTGKIWRMTAYDDGKGDFPSARRDVTVTAEFGTDGQVTGSGGCNDYRARYTQDGETLVLGPVILLSRKPCAGEVRDQERAFLATLRSATRVEAEGSQLLLTRTGGTRVASFAAESPPPAGDDTAAGH